MFVLLPLVLCRMSCEIAQGASDNSRLWPPFDNSVTLARMLRKLSSVLLFVACAVVLVGARVVRVEVTSRNDVLSGKPFGDAGSYERILGRVYYAVPVTNPHNWGWCGKLPRTPPIMFAAGCKAARHGSCRD